MKPNPSLTGTFKKHQAMPSAFLQPTRDVLVYLPPSYATLPEQRYPVLYVHDGNNIFDKATSYTGVEWMMDEHTQSMIQAGLIQEIIVVGIYNTAARMDEYTWYPTQVDGKIQGGKGPDYARFVVEELKPMIDKTYRTQPGREATASMGSSLGALISFYLGLTYPSIFSQLALMSPSVWWAKRRILEDAQRVPKNLKIWVDVGTQEGEHPQSMVRNAHALVHVFERQGYQHFVNLAFHVAEGATHHEHYWAERLTHPLLFFYGKT